jgi:hypothetical protein
MAVLPTETLRSISLAPGISSILASSLLEADLAFYEGFHDLAAVQYDDPIGHNIYYLRNLSIRVGTSDAGHAFRVVATRKKVLDRLGDPLQAGAAQSAGIVGLIEGRKLREVNAEQPLQRAGTPLPVGA